MRERQLREGELTGQLQRRLAEADVTGTFGYDDQGRPIQTRQAQMDAFNQALAEAGLTGLYDGAETLAGRADVRAERGFTDDLLSSQLQRRLAEADVTGTFGFDDQGRPIQTRQAQMDAFNQALAEAGLTGQYEGADTFQRALAEAGLTGQYEGADTLAGRQSAEALLASRLQRALAEADVTGIYDRQETRQAQMDNFNRLLAEAGLTGDFRGEDTLAQQQLDDALTSSALNRLLAQAADTRAGQAQEAALFGEVSGVGSDPTVRRTMGREALDQQSRNALIDQIIALGDKSQEGKFDTFASVLAERLSGPEGQALSDTMGLSVVPELVTTEMRSTKTWSNEDKEAYQAAINILNEGNQQETNPPLRRQQWGIIRRLEEKYGVVSKEEYLEAQRGGGG